MHILRVLLQSHNVGVLPRVEDLELRMEAEDVGSAV